MKLIPHALLLALTVALSACGTTNVEKTKPKGQSVEYGIFIISNDSFEGITGYPADSAGFSPAGRSAVSELLFKAVESSDLKLALNKEKTVGANPTQELSYEPENKIENGSLVLISVVGTLEAVSAENNFVEVNCNLRCKSKDTAKGHAWDSGPVWPGSTFYLNPDNSNELMRVAGTPESSIFFIARLKTKS